MNSIAITGNLVVDPELRETAGGTAVCKLRLAVEGLGRGNEVGYIDVDSYGPSAEAASRTIRKGWKIGVTGRLEFREYTDKNDVKRTAYTVVGHIEYLSSPKSDADPAGAREEPAVPAGVGASGDDDIPF